jgi:hypothetical protein
MCGTQFHAVDKGRVHCDGTCSQTELYEHPMGQRGWAAGKEQLQCIGFELAAALASPYASTDGRTFPIFTPHNTKTLPAKTKRVAFTEESLRSEQEDWEANARSIEHAEKKAAAKALCLKMREDNLHLNCEIVETLKRIGN